MMKIMSSFQYTPFLTSNAQPSKRLPPMNLNLPVSEHRSDQAGLLIGSASA